jgi:hypothetical protein
MENKMHSNQPRIVETLLVGKGKYRTICAVTYAGLKMIEDELPQNVLEKGDLAGHAFQVGSLEYVARGLVAGLDYALQRVSYLEDVLYEEQKRGDRLLRELNDARKVIREHEED